MTNYQMVFKQTQYQSVSDRAAKYYQETAKSYPIPMIDADPGMLEYRHTDLLDPEASYGGLDYTEEGRAATTIHEFVDIQLFVQECKLRFNANEMRIFGAALIADKRDVQLAKWALDVDDSIFHGPKNEQGIQLAEGLIGQLTSMENLNGNDSNLATKGYIWKALIKMINGIPWALREEGPDMLLYVTPHLWEKLISPDRVYMDMQEIDLIRKNLMGENAQKGFRIGAVIITNKILAEASDDTEGYNHDAADVEGTHDRMLLMVPDRRWIGRIISDGFHLVGEDRTINGGVKQNWGWRGRGYVFNTNCAEYTEALYWSALE